MPRHGVGAESPKRMRATRFTADLCEASHCFDSRIGGLHEETCLAIVYKFLHRPAVVGDDRCATHHGFGDAESERFFKADGMQQCYGVSKKFSTRLWSDVAFVINTRVIQVRHHLLIEIAFILNQAAEYQLFSRGSGDADRFMCIFVRMNPSEIQQVVAPSAAKREERFVDA